MIIFFMVFILEILANHKWEEKGTIYLIFVGKVSEDLRSIQT